MCLFWCLLSSNHCNCGNWIALICNHCICVRCTWLVVYCNFPFRKYNEEKSYIKNKLISFQMIQVDNKTFDNAIIFLCDKLMSCFEWIRIQRRLQLPTNDFIWDSIFVTKQVISKSEDHEAKRFLASVNAGENDEGVDDQVDAPLRQQGLGWNTTQPLWSIRSRM